MDVLLFLWTVELWDMLSVCCQHDLEKTDHHRRWQDWSVDDVWFHFLVLFYLRRHVNPSINVNKWLFKSSVLPPGEAVLFPKKAESRSPIFLLFTFCWESVEKSVPFLRIRSASFALWLLVITFPFPALSWFSPYIEMYWDWGTWVRAGMDTQRRNNCFGSADISHSMLDARPLRDTSWVKVNKSAYFFINGSIRSRSWQPSL